ncbi:ROK family transcriptional regulator [Jatrophihabitans sp. YIM 134969]
MSDDAGSLPGLRLRNRRQILEVVRHRGTTSRPEIAKRTGLSPTTVSTLVAQLLAESVVVELADRAAPTGGGRPARLLGFNPAAGGAVGVHLAHDHVRVGVTDLGGAVVAEHVTDLDVDHEPARTLAVVADEALQLVDRAGLRRDGVVGLGVAVSAPVSVATHVVDSGVILSDWQHVDLAAEIAERTGFTVSIGNDANLGAVAEHRFGAAQDVDDLVWVMVSDGVGAGLVVDGTLYEGAFGGAGELGHVTVTPGGFVCRCGNRGCLETVAGGAALRTALTYTHGERITLADIIAADRAGDERAGRAMSDAGVAVGRALAPVCTVLDPALVVIGGDCSASVSLVDAVRRTLADTATPLRRQAVPVRASALGDQAEMLGAVALATQRMTLA